MDGNTLVVGGWSDDYYYGAAWIFTRDHENNWSQQSPKIIGTRGLGLSCTINAIGNVVMISGAGNILVYSRDSVGLWSLTGIIPNLYVNDITPLSLSADGKTALVGISNVTVVALVVEYNAQSNTWEKTALLETTSNLVQFSVALSSDGNTAVIGTPGFDNYGGAAWVFTRDVQSGSWSQIPQILIGNDISKVPYQGFSVSVSGNGDTVVFGGPEDGGGVGATWVFRKPTSAPVTNSPKHSKKTHKRISPTSQPTIHGETRAPVSKRGKKKKHRHG